MYKYIYAHIHTHTYIYIIPNKQTWLSTSSSSRDIMKGRGWTGRQNGEV